MRILILTVLLTVSAFAQNQPADMEAACGPKGVSFAVKQDDSRHELAQPKPGKALIYFIQVSGVASCFPARCVMKIGLDGTWVGAFKVNSYFSVSVDPGEHHTCMNVQSGTRLGRLVAFARITAEAGKVYYLRTQAFPAGNTIHLQIDAIDSDQAKYLISSSPLSVSQPEK